MAQGSGFALGPDAPRTFPDWIRQRALVGADKVALEIGGVTRTYAELDHVTDRTAAGFAALGLEAGEHVSVMMQNSLENIEAWFGLQKAGLVEVPIHTASRGTALRYIVDHADAGALVVDEAFLPHLAAVADELPQLRHVIVNRNEPGDGPVDLPSRLAVHDLADLYASDGPTPAPHLQRQDTAVILHSSGTTGPPKGVVLSHGAVLHLTRHIVWLMGYTSDDRLYTAFPLFHNNAKYTSVTAALECGGSVVMDKRFPVSTFWEMAPREGGHRVQLHGRAADDAAQAAAPGRRRRQPDPDRVRRPVSSRDLGGIRAPLRRRPRRGLRHDRGADGLREPAREPQDRLGRP